MTNRWQANRKGNKWQHNRPPEASASGIAEALAKEAATNVGIEGENHAMTTAIREETFDNHSPDN